MLKGSPALLGEGSGCFGQAVEEAGEVGSIREEKVTGAKKYILYICVCVYVFMCIHVITEHMYTL